MEIFRVIAANDHGESVFEAERLGDFKMEAIGVEPLDAVIDGVRVIVMCDTLAVRIWGFIQDGSEGSAGVFDVEVELASKESFVDEEAAAKVGLSNDGDTSFGFDVLRQELGEDDLLGEKFRADGDFGLRRFGASGKKVDEVKEIKEVKESELGAAHVRKLLIYARQIPTASRPGGLGARREWRRQG